MNNQHQEFRIGIMVLAALAALVVLTIFFGKGTSMNLGDEYAIQVRFQRTPGINRNSPVFKNGVKIGRVSKVELVDGDREVEITILLPKQRKIYTNEECRIRQTVIMGDASLEFVKKLNYTGKVEEIDPGKPIPGGTSGDLMSGFMNIEGDLTKAIKDVSDAAVQFTTVANQVGVFMDKVNVVTGTPEEMQVRMSNFEATTMEMRQSMESMRQLTEGANKLVNDPKIQDGVRQVVETMPEILERTKTLIEEANRFSKDVRDLIERSKVVAEKVDRSLDKADIGLDNFNEITGRIKGDVPEISENLKKSSEKLQSLFDELTMIVEGFRNADGTVKRLMRDPAVYEKLLSTIENVEQLTDEVNRMLRTDVKPITNNVKIITDKAARDPSIFIRNLFRKEPPIKGNLPIWGDGLGSDTLGNLTCGLDGFTRESMFHSFPMETPGPVLEGPEGMIDVDGTPTMAPEELLVPPETKPNPLTGMRRRLSSLIPFIQTQAAAEHPGDRELREPEPLSPPGPLKPLFREEDGEDDGRIVHADPRYPTLVEEGVYRQMSHSTESDTPLKLNFTKKP